MDGILTKPEKGAQLTEIIEIYTDGACRGNPGPGGWGALMRYRDKEKALYGGAAETTNNRMELLAVIVALETIKPGTHAISIYSDSKYVVDAVNKQWIQGWVRKNWKDVKNIDLWQRLIPLLQAYKPTFIWVKGHADNPLNNRCDELATLAADGTGHLKDVVYEAIKAGQ
jgi:ribonuclease HI